MRLTHYGFNEIITLAGVERSKLTHWADRGMVPPDISESAGRGHGRRYSFRNVVEFALARELTRSLGWAAAGAALRHLRDSGVWERLRERSTRSECGVLVLDPIEATSAAEAEMVELLGPALTVMSRKQVQARVADGRYLTMTLVNLEALLAAMEAKAEDELL
jgi:DNA-binding transcriptional MerR regulator